ncbi:MAG: hypothetical protein MK192_04610 [Idiomarina sp.]|nr:hypothetical protein [Idiomarina sp.]
MSVRIHPKHALAEARLIEQRLQAELMGAIAKSQMLEALVTGSEKDILERQAEIKGDSVGPSVKKEFKLSLERAMKGVSSQVVVKDSGRNEPSASDESDEKPNQSITGDIHKLLEYKGEE